MTPKEKAKELFDKFNNPDRTNYPYVHNAQQCALIAVDEMNKVYESLDEDSDLIFKKELKYLLEVKQEIEKL